MRHVYALIYLFLFACPAAAECRLALTLALDISGSVNKTEYRLQLDGIADALLDEEVQLLLLGDPSQYVSLSVYEWSGAADQQLALNWQDVRSAKDLNDIAAFLRGHKSPRQSLHTSIGSALEFGRVLLSAKPECAMHTIDVSGDGKNNRGLTPKAVYERGGFERITVNGLAIAVEDQRYDLAASQHQQRDLKRYFEREVIHGTAAFTILARGYTDFKRAMTKKLIRELSPPMMSQNDAAGALPL